MGTNYYTKTQKCPTCGHKPEGIHLGKSSGGWVFSFQYNGGRYYKNVEEMKLWLKAKRIVNEYGENVTQKEFWEMIEEKQKNKDNWNHAGKYPSDHDFVINGYSFSDCYFS
jgi:hypothetical protein